MIGTNRHLQIIDGRCVRVLDADGGTVTERSVDLSGFIAIAVETYAALREAARIIANGADHDRP
jgi:hypothetical protein